MRRSHQFARPSKRTPRPFLGILFDCCDVYARIYRDPAEPRYEGRCPRCLRTVTVRVESEGTTARFFRAS